MNRILQKLNDTKPDLRNKKEKTVYEKHHNLLNIFLSNINKKVEINSMFVNFDHRGLNKQLNSNYPSSSVLYSVLDGELFSFTIYEYPIGFDKNVKAKREIINPKKDKLYPNFLKENNSLFQQYNETIRTIKLMKRCKILGIEIVEKDDNFYIYINVLMKKFNSFKSITTLYIQNIDPRDITFSPRPNEPEVRLTDLEDILLDILQEMDQNYFNINNCNDMYKNDVPSLKQDDGCIKYLRADKYYFDYIENLKNVSPYFQEFKQAILKNNSYLSSINSS